MKTLFVAGGTGFIGKLFVEQAVAAGLNVQALTRSEASARAIRAAGARPVSGDLMMPGSWQQIAAQADLVVHLAQPPTFGARVTKARAEAYRRDRVIMDEHLLRPLYRQAGSRVERIVYVSGTSYYGHQGNEPRDESTPPNPRGWGPYVIPALDALGKHIQDGLPVVTAFPGAVYGPGSWFVGVLEALAANRRLVGLREGLKYNSGLHVADCAGAILHLALHGTPGERYFVVDNQPYTTLNLAQTTAKALGVPLRTLLVPPWVARLIIGPVITDSLTYSQVLSNAKLRGTGFVPKFPTIAEGIPDVVAQWRRQPITQT